MGTFDVHSDIADLPGLSGPDGLAAVGLFMAAGQWTSRNGRSGVVTDEAVRECMGQHPELVDRLVGAGLWERMDGGYRMLRGPHSDPDLPMPLWRYSDTDTGGRLFVVDDTPNT